MASPCVVPTQKRLPRSGLMDSTTPDSGPVRSTGIALPSRSQMQKAISILNPYGLFFPAPTS